MSPHISRGRGMLRLLLVVAMAAGLSTVNAGTSHAAVRAVAAVAAGAQTQDTWHMDESSGTSMDDSTGSHPGKLHSINLGQTGDPSVAAGGSGYGFNGTSSYVSIPDSADLNAHFSEVHISFSLRTSTVPAKPDYDLFRKGEAPGQEYKVELQPNGQASCTFIGTLASVTVQAGPDLHDGKWHRIQCEKFDSSVRLTIDGASFSKTRAVGSISNTFNMIVGAYPTGDFYKGDLDELTFQVAGSSVTKPTASFTASKTSGSTPLTVSFKDTSSGSPTGWTWRFGDGATSSVQNASHVYTRAGTYTVTLTVSNSVGSDSATGTIAATDTTAPQGTFVVGPRTTAWATSTRVTITQTSLSDDSTPVGSIRRTVDWRDGTGAVAWASGTTTSHVYAGSGSYTPIVTLTDQAGNTARITMTTVTVRSDTASPVASLQRPVAHRASVAAWRLLHGHVADAAGGSGVQYVAVRLIEKRGSTWYAYRARSHSWVRAGTRARALRMSVPARVAPHSISLWSLRVPGLRRGSLVVQITARDRAGNTSRVLSYRQLLTRP